MYTTPPDSSPLRAVIERELARLFRHRRLLVSNTSVVVVLGFAVSFLAGDQFTGSTTILPPAAGGSPFDDVLRRVSVVSAAGAVTVMDEIARVIESRRVLDRVVERNDLRAVYKAKTAEHAYLGLKDRVTIDIERGGILRVSFRDKSPERVAAVLASIVDEVDQFYVETRRTRGRLLAELIEARIDSTRERLANAQAALGRAQSEAISIGREDGSAKALAELTARSYMLEVELDALSHASPAGTPAIATRRAELESIRAELARQPRLTLEEARLRRDLTVQRDVLDLLTAQLAAARAMEAREIPFIDVLDAPTPPPLRSWPGYVQIVFSSLVLSLAAGVLLVHVVDYIEANRPGFRTLFDVGSARRGSTG